MSNTTIVIVSHVDSPMVDECIQNAARLSPSKIILAANGISLTKYAEKCTAEIGISCLYIESSENSGSFSRPANKAINWVNTDYFIPIAYDDLLHEDTNLELLEREMKDWNADILSGCIITQRISGGRSKKKQTGRDGYSFDDIMKNNKLTGVNMYRKSKVIEVGKYDERDKWGEELALNIKMLKAGAKCFTTQNLTYVYRIHGRNKSMNERGIVNKSDERVQSIKNIKSRYR